MQHTAVGGDIRVALMAGCLIIDEFRRGRLAVRAVVADEEYTRLAAVPDAGGTIGRPAIYDRAGLGRVVDEIDPLVLLVELVRRGASGCIQTEEGIACFAVISEVAAVARCRHALSLFAKPRVIRRAEHRHRLGVGHIPLLPFDKGGYDRGLRECLSAVGRLYDRVARRLPVLPRPLVIGDVDVTVGRDRDIRVLNVPLRAW